MLRPFSLSKVSLFLLATLPGRVLSTQVLSTSGFSTCLSGSNITVQNLDIQYNADTMAVTFNVAGTSATVQNVTAQLNVTAYGISVYQNKFNPCDAATFVQQLCPGQYSESTRRLCKANMEQFHPAPSLLPVYSRFQRNTPRRSLRLLSRFPILRLKQPWS